MQSVKLTSRTGFLDLPYELRLEVYKYSIPQNLTFNPAASLFITREIQRTTHSVLPSLLQVSHQISDEALDFLYGGIIFITNLRCTPQECMKQFFIKVNNRQRVRKIKLYIPQKGDWYRHKFKIDKTMWNDILPRLRCLCIVAEHPSNRNQKEMNEWIKRITPVFQYFGKMLPADTRVLIDVNKTDEAVKLIQKYLVHGFRQVRTATGDYTWGRWYREDPADDADYPESG